MHVSGLPDFGRGRGRAFLAQSTAWKIQMKPVTNLINHSAGKEANGGAWHMPEWVQLLAP